MGQELQIPESFKTGQMAKAFQALAVQDDNLSDGIGQSYPVIGYKGKVWSLRYRGERKTFIRPDDGTQLLALDVIILGQAKVKSKSYYKKVEGGYVEGERPLCNSMDGVTPDSDVQFKQADHCVLCPRNVWKTDPNTGRKGRECTDYKRLAVLVLPTLTKPLFGKPLVEPVFLRVPPDSLNSLSIMGDTMEAQGYNYFSYITRITFDPNKAHPCMVFRPLQGLTDAEAPVVIELRNDPTVPRITTGEASAMGLVAVREALASPGTTQTGLGAQSVPTVASPPTQPNALGLSGVSSPRSPLLDGVLNQSTTNPSLGSTAGVQHATPSPETLTATALSTLSTPSGIVDTGFGGVQNASIVVPASVNASDVGEAEESDADLDAKIALLIAH